MATVVRYVVYSSVCGGAYIRCKEWSRPVLCRQVMSVKWLYWHYHIREHSTQSVRPVTAPSDSAGLMSVAPPLRRWGLISLLFWVSKNSLPLRPLPLNFRLIFPRYVRPLIKQKITSARHDPLFFIWVVSGVQVDPKNAGWIRCSLKSSDDAETL